MAEVAHAAAPTRSAPLTVPVPLANLSILAGGTLAVMLLVVAIGWLFLRMSTDLEELRVG
jgi:hypothetical protein